MSVAIQDADGDYGAVIVSGANLAISTDVVENPAVWENAAVLLLQNEVPESLNIVAAAKARSLGLTVCLNAAPARDMSMKFLDLVDVLVVNAVEAEALGSDVVDSLAAAGQAAQKLSARFPTVVVTAGGDGVAACSAGGDVLCISAKPIQVVSTHGAGDVFTGVLCAELASRNPLTEAIKIANEQAADHVAAR
jgi:ribokinase